LLCIRTQVSENRTKNLLAYFVMMTSAQIANVTSNKYRSLSRNLSNYKIIYMIIINL